MTIKDDEVALDATLLDEVQPATVDRASTSTLELSTTLAPQPIAGVDTAGSSLPGYELGPRIGEGGMGEVVAGRDRAIGREVAIKRIRTGKSSPHAVSRFLREARIQARLEHPAIVPVHVLGRDAAGNPFFTMKRVTGATLAEHVCKEPPPSIQELLRIFIDVCRAIQLAHAGGVVHRDLKPANIMLGNFGEVYVLDWGVARIVDETEVVARPGDVASLDGLTEEGALFGTPGYMAPEQVEGSPHVGPPADVYALGAILFAILTGERLHEPGPGVLARTLGGVDGSPARRKPMHAIPPELDALCSEALATSAAARPTVDVLADRIQRYLDGDRDHEQRRILARRELATAQSMLASGDVTRRAEAIRSAGRALALDPESHEAASLITALMIEPPKQHPPALAEDLFRSDVRVQRRQGRAAVVSLGAVLVFLGAAAISGARDPALLGGIAAYTGAVALLGWSASRRAAKPLEMWLVAAGNAMLAALLSRLFGPLIVAPVVTCIMAVSLTSYPQLMHHARWVIAMLLASWIGPLVLEHLGLLEATWRVDDGSVVSMSSVIRLGGGATSALLIGANVLAITVIGLFANSLARSRHAAQREVEIQAWQLRQLLPDR